MTYGIDISNFVKTEKNLTELQIEQNIKWDFAMTGEDGSSLKPVFGSGLTGFKNLGNSCYLASVVQVLFSIPAFKKCYFSQEGVPAEKILGNNDPSSDLETQLYKIGDGLLSGRYSVPDTTTTEEVKYQKGIKPSSFKFLVGQGHQDFCTAQQQDAFEFWLYLNDLIEKRKAFGNFEISPTEVFKFVLENKLKCTSCGGVRMSKEIQENICLPTQDILLSTDEEGKRNYQETTIEESIQKWLTPETIEYHCPKCAKKVTALKSQGFKSFPSYLVVSPQRIKIENWVPMKLEVPIKFEEHLDLTNAKSKGKLPNEEEIPEDESETKQEEFKFNEGAMNALLSMGFPEQRCKRALYNTGNESNAEVAMNWLFAHMDDPDIDSPFEVPTTTSSNSKKSDPNQAKESDIETLVSMGFTSKLSNKALVLNNHNVEQAVDWLFSHPDDDGVLPAPAADGVAAGNEVSKEEKISTLEHDSGALTHSKYHLKAVICHKGGSIHSGHYVAFIKTRVPEGNGDEGKGEGEGEEKWVLFNDEKVTLVEDVNLKDVEKSGYLYLFARDSN
ncbi:unnamed protein product [Ambrosiozyma monospora]|uniref:Unnamed protein product n=1 Tax=Ambrosiozyma monospora TaxID=43982 RepID=A0ACB5T4S6_AMBMO|nr:unnamed protein product [Ambrosiozyma monospora]